MTLQTIGLDVSTSRGKIANGCFNSLNIKQTKIIKPIAVITPPRTWLPRFGGINVIPTISKINPTNNKIVPNQSALGNFNVGGFSLNEYMHVINPIVPNSKFIQKQYSQPQYSTKIPPKTGPKPLATEKIIEFKLMAKGILSYSQYWAVILKVFDILNAPAIP